jgi:hypothetical protein
MSDVQKATDPIEATSPSLPRGVRFGACVGLFAGAAVGGFCCWLVGQNELLWPATLIVAVIGFTGGGFIGARQMRNPRKAGSPDIATYICVLYALFPAGLVLLGGLGWVFGKFSGYLVLAAAFGIPMAASLVGAILDRIYESSLRRNGQ